MMYIDPKDQPIDGPDEVFNAAWNERVRLRLDLFQLQQKVAGLDTWITTYQRFGAQSKVRQS